MMRDDALNSYIDPVVTEMTGMQHIPISHVWSMDKSESKEFIAEKILSQVCSTDKGESESVIINESSTEERESGSVCKV